MTKKQKAYVYLYILLAIWVIADTFPLLGIKPISESEQSIMDFALAFRWHSLAEVFTNCNNGNIEQRAYCYMVNLLDGIYGQIDYAYWLRVPSAMVTVILSLALFRFGRYESKVGEAFTAALIFLSCAYVSLLTYSTNVIMIPAVLLILVLISLCHWLKSPSKRSTIMLLISFAASIVFCGIPILIFASIIGLGYLCSEINSNWKGWAKFILSIVGGIFLAYAFIYIITGDKGIALNILSDWHIVSNNGFNDLGAAYIFIKYVIFALFPWSIPLLISLKLVIRNYEEVRKGFNELTFSQRFGVYMFAISTPSLFFYTQLSFALLLASVFFNATTIAHILTMQFNKHPERWRIVGVLLGVASLAIVVLYILANNGISNPFFELSVKGWHWMSIFLVTSIIISIYTLWRNWREIYRNHRFLFNMIILYLLTANLFIAFIIPNTQIGF